MDEPVGISILGALLIVVAAGCVAGLLAWVTLGGGAARMFAEMALGVAGAWAVIFFLPMHGYVIGNAIGWYAAPIAGASAPIVVGRALFRRH